MRVVHEQPGGDSPFDPANGFVRPLDGLTAFKLDHEVQKHRHSCLVGTDLHAWLQSENVSPLAISGIRTEQCCETTSRHGSDEGYIVDYGMDATLTFAMVHSDGSTFSVADIRQRTATVLNDRFATIVSVPDAIERAVRAMHHLVLLLSVIDVLFVVEEQSLLLTSPVPPCFSLCEPTTQRCRCPTQFALGFVGTAKRPTSSVRLVLGELDPLPTEFHRPTWVVLVGKPSAARLRIKCCESGCEKWTHLRYLPTFGW